MKGLAEFDLPVWAALSLALFFGVMWGISACPELSNTQDYPDYDFYKEVIRNWNPIQHFDMSAFSIKYLLAKISVDVFHNAKIIPFVLSSSLLAVSYLFSVQITGKRWAGVITVLIISISSLFKFFDTSPAYDNSWILFYFLSLYMIKRKWLLSPVFFVMAVTCKPLVLLFLPALLLMVWESPQRKKMLIVYCLVSVLFGIIAPLHGSYDNVPFSPDGFMSGLMDWWWFMFSDLYMVVAVPLVMAMLLWLGLKRKGTIFLLVMMLNLSLYGAILEGFTKDIWNEPYRYIPLVVAFALSVPVILNIIAIENTRKGSPSGVPLSKAA